MSNETEFVDGLIVKPPHEKAPDFVKAALSIKREALIAWLQGREGEWVNLDVKVSKSGKWYAAVNAYKPKDAKPPQHKPEPPQDDGFIDDSIPF